MNHPYSQVEGDLNWQKVFKPTPFCKKIATREKLVVVVMKEEDEEDVKVGKIWMDGEILHLISLWRKMNLKFVQNAKKQDKLDSLLEILVVLVLIEFLKKKSFRFESFSFFRSKTQMHW